jgi:hypothetical protein
MRRSIEPFLSGDTFRLNCDYVCDETKEWPDLSHVKRNDIIFVKTDYLKMFYDISKSIKEPFVLVTHNSDHRTGVFLNDQELKDLLSRCTYFGQNNSLDGVKSIPIGIANAAWPHGNPENVFRLFPSTIEKLNTLFMKPKANLVCMSVNILTNPSLREPVVSYFQKIGIANTLLNWELYIRLLQDSYFCVCPEGNGPDTHRVWEVLYNGCIPIVLFKTTPDLFRDLPVLAVDNWESVTKEMLLNKIDDIRKGNYKFEKLFYPYWKNQLKSN